MSGKMKKLICAMLASTMLVSSIGLVGFAADTETAAETTAVEATETPAEATEAPAAEATEAPAAEATEAPAEATEAPAAEATEAPAAATAAPVAESSMYEDDAYYQKALSLCKALGIITGYEDGSVKPESTVTRAEMAAIILRMLNSNSASTYQGIFSDVTAEHWAAGTIQTAAALKIVNGMGDGTFQPDGNVTYEQVAKMIVCAMNFGETGEYYGGYPNGYLKAAADMNITKNAAGTTGVASERGVVIKMVYNALLADYNEPNGTEYGKPVFKAERTLAEYAFDVKEDKGILLGTSTTSLTGKDLLDGQVMIDEQIYSTDLKDLDSILASNVTFYYADEDNGDNKKLLAIVENSLKTETVTLDNAKVNDIEEFNGFDDDTATGEIKLYGSKRYKIAKDPMVVYNGSVITEKDFDDAKAKNPKDVRFVGKSYNDFLQPSVGTIKLVENNSEVDGYDIVFVDAYETLLVASATDKKVTGKISGEGVSITVDENANDLTIKTTINNMEAAPRNLKKDNVASLKRSLDNTNLEFTVTGESITGSAKSVVTEDGKLYATINNTKYEVDKNAEDNCKIGSQAIFYLDMFDRIGFIDGASAGRLQSGEAYGWLMGAYESEDKEDLIVKIMTQDGKAEEFKVATSVTYWAPNNITGSEKISKAKFEESIKDAIDNDKFPHMWKGTRHTDGTTADGERRYSWEPLYSIRLVKYKVNSNKEITKFYGAVNVVNEAEKYYSASSDYVKNGKNITDPYVDSDTAASLKASDALIFDMTSKAGSTLVGGMTGGYSITDDILEFKVPNNANNYSKAGAYKIGNVVASVYNQRENGVADDYILADMDGASPAVLIRFIADATVPGSPADMDNVANTPAMVVDTIARGADEDENTIYQISGFSGGSELSVTTNSASACAELTGYNDKKYAIGDILWDANSSTSLDSVIHKGDIIISDGTNILVYSCVKDIYEKLQNGESISKYVAGSNTRNYFKFDAVTDYEVDDPSMLTIGSETFSFDASKAMATVEIDLAKPIESAVNILKETSTVSDLNVYDETEGGDYAFARFADKGNLQEIIIYRFINADKISQ